MTSSGGSEHLVNLVVSGNDHHDKSLHSAGVGKSLHNAGFMNGYIDAKFRGRRHKVNGSSCSRAMTRRALLDSDPPFPGSHS